MFGLNLTQSGNNDKLWTKYEKQYLKALKSNEKQAEIGVQLIFGRREKTENTQVRRSAYGPRQSLWHGEATTHAENCIFMA